MNHPTQPAKPEFYAYAIRETVEGRTVSLQIGVAWERIDGKPGFYVKLEAYPVRPEFFLLPADA